jgi:SAM-dependent methyltransferase
LAHCIPARARMSSGPVRPYTDRLSAATLTGVRSYYEDLWERLPDDLTPPDLELRRGFLLANTGAGERALDLGCGNGLFTAELLRAGSQAIGVEVAEAALARARAQHASIDFRLAPIDGRLPLEDSEVDLVWCSEVIEHVADTARWLSEVRRVLAPGGRLLLTTPSHGRLRVALGGVERFSEPLGDHLHLYTRRSLEQLLREFRFAEIQIRGAGGAPLLRTTLLARAVR